MSGNLWWLINKDLVTEWRARRAWPAMLVLGAIVAVLVSLQLDTLADEKQRVVGGLLWLAIFFAGMIAVDRSFAAERENGCWEGSDCVPVERNRDIRRQIHRERDRLGRRAGGRHTTVRDPVRTCHCWRRQRPCAWSPRWGTSASPPSARSSAQWPRGSDGTTSWSFWCCRW